MMLGRFSSLRGSSYLGQEPVTSQSSPLSATSCGPALRRRRPFRNLRGSFQDGHERNGDMAANLVASIGALLLLAARGIFVLDRVGAWALLLAGALIGFGLHSEDFATRA